ncbi:MAG: YceI family protein [Tepidisphaeraceae bacterium]|jgi:polyisoprenoid-binding protein YceI
MIKRYPLDSQRSRFTVQAFATGMLAGFAHNPKFVIRQFGGEMRLDPEIPAESSFEMTVQAASLELIDNVKEKDREEIQDQVMNEVLEVSKYPEITFASTGITLTKIANDWFRAQLRGDMRLHGVTKTQSIDVQLRRAERDLRLTGDFTLMLPDYRIKRVTALGGMIKLKDDLKFQFDLVGQETNS